MVFDAQKMDEFIRWLMQQLPDSNDDWRDSVEQKIRAGLEPMLKKMNLISREEYDVQVALLDRMRQKLDSLEQRLHQLEQSPHLTQSKRSHNGQ